MRLAREARPVWPAILGLILAVLVGQHIPGGFSPDGKSIVTVEQKAIVLGDRSVGDVVEVTKSRPIGAGDRTGRFRPSPRGA